MLVLSGAQGSVIASRLKTFCKSVFNIVDDIFMYRKAILCNFEVLEELSYFVSLQRSVHFESVKKRICTCLWRNTIGRVEC